MPEHDPFWIDAEYDREHASDGVSRYGAYIRQATFEPWDDEGHPVELAVFAWRQATGPVMAPGYVRRHRRILAARLERSDWDGSLLAMVDLVIPQPDHLRTGVKGAGYWHDWPIEHAFFGADYFCEPGTEELARGPYLLATASLRFTVPSGDLPQPHRDGSDVATCQQSVAVLVAELNAIVGPVIKRIEES